MLAAGKKTRVGLRTVVHFDSNDFVNAHKGVEGSIEFGYAGVIGCKG